MRELIVRADVEALLIDWLAAVLPSQGWDVPVAGTLAAGERTEAVAVFRTGGPMANMVIDAATIAVEAKGRLESRSSALINRVVALIHSLEGFELGEFGVTRVQEFSGPALLPVADSPTRYTQTLSVEIQAQIL